MIRFLKGKNGSIDYYMDAKSHNLKMYPVIIRIVKVE